MALVVHVHQKIKGKKKKKAKGQISDYRSYTLYNPTPQPASGGMRKKRESKTTTAHGEAGS